MAVPTVRTVNAKIQSYLAEAASSEAGWRRYLETLSRHTGCANAFYNLSAMNCAWLAASDWHECREILPISTWKSLFPGADIKAGEQTLNGNDALQHRCFGQPEIERFVGPFDDNELQRGAGAPEKRGDGE